MVSLHSKATGVVNVFDTFCFLPGSLHALNPCIVDICRPRLGLEVITCHLLDQRPRCLQLAFSLRSPPHAVKVPISSKTFRVFSTLFRPLLKEWFIPPARPVAVLPQVKRFLVVVLQSLSMSASNSSTNFTCGWPGNAFKISLRCCKRLSLPLKCSCSALLIAYEGHAISG